MFLCWRLPFTLIRKLNPKIAMPLQGVDALFDKGPGLLVSTLHRKGFFLHKVDEGIGGIGILKVKGPGTRYFLRLAQIIAAMKHMIQITGEVVKAVWDSADPSGAGKLGDITALPHIPINDICRLRRQYLTVSIEGIFFPFNVFLNNSFISNKYTVCVS